MSVILGLWPIAGVTTVGVSRDDARSTIAAAIDAGIRRFDTAYSYGYDGESDRLIGEFLQTDRDAFELIGKAGQRWTPDRKRVVDGRPQTLTADVEESLRRAGLDHFDVLMLHSPDPDVPLSESAAAIDAMRRSGKAKRIGICNADENQRKQFAAVAGCDAIQCPLNLLQQDSLDTLIRPAAADGAQCHVYWTLMKGLLAGKIGRDHQFPEGDSRPKYDVFQGEKRERAHRIVDALRDIGSGIGRSVASLSIGWAVSQDGVSGALVGARRPDQILETADATALDASTLAQIDQLLADV
ncbi:aldo/keto reductase [Crateriforma conspicua]|uniref:General stress protein 69 n=1 Tax=Crateriforma conspicua TaxID=2527996 RepID=A0A5C6FXW2_9PLAN|nr:aldo/keto reductase [Crateriforma conspicua]TWU67226.1 General stress protein 69 [Crateriforma conspicua]